MPRRRAPRLGGLNKFEKSWIDLLLAGDICFWDELVKPVCKMVDTAVAAGVGKIVIADPERPTFHDMAQRCLDKHGGELVNWRTKGSVEASGALLIINNH